MKTDLRETILNYLSGHRVMTLATLADGRPHAADLYYVNDGFDLYFLSKPEARHCVNISKNPVVAVTIHGEHDDWREIRGIQGDGTASVVEGTLQKARVMTLYIKKFPFVQGFFSSPRFAGLMTRIKFYRVALDTVWYIDNSSGYFNRESLKVGRPD